LNVGMVGRWAIACETEKNIHKHKRGVISMAHAGKDGQVEANFLSVL